MELFKVNVGAYSRKMDGAVPGDLRGFEDQDGSQSYTFQSDGSVSLTIFGKHEEIRIKCDGLLKTTEAEEFYKQVLELKRFQSDRDPLPDEEIFDFEVNEVRSKFFKRIIKKEMANFPDIKLSLSAGRSKAVGRISSVLGGLDID